MRRQLARWGNSLAVRLPVDYLRAAGLKEGDEVEAEFTPRGEIRLTPAQPFDKGAFLERLRRFRENLPVQSESAGELLRRMRDEDGYDGLSRHERRRGAIRAGSQDGGDRNLVLSQQRSSGSG